MSSSRDRLSWKTSHLIRSEISELLVNALIADDKYSCDKREKLVQPIQMKLSKIPNTSLKFFIAFLKFTSNLEYLEKKDKPESLSISKSMDSKKSVYFNI